MEKSPPLDIAAMLFLLFLCLIRGGNFIAIKVSLSGLKPLLSSGGRNFIAASVLIFYVWCMRRQFRYPRQQVVILLFMGVVLAANFAIVYSGMQYTTASRSSIILNAQPLFVALLTRFFLKGDKATSRKFLGLTLSFIGIVVVFADKDSSLAFQTITGDLMILCAAFIWSILVILRKWIAQKVDITSVAMYELGTSAFLLLPAGFVFEGPGSIHLSVPVVTAVLYSALLGSAFAFTANVYLLKKYDVNAVSSFNFITPLAGTTFGILLLGDTFSLQIGIGALLVALGIYVVNR